MIPKIIHYCWFGNNPKNNLIARCIESWKKFCPDFEIIEWTEDNTKKYQNKFYKDALRKKKYAFVSDCIRSQALQEFGGIYLDTDMLLLKPISEELLRLDFFTGYEVEDRAAYGFFGATPNHRFLQKMVQFYSTTEFNEFSLPVITHTFKSLINDATLAANERIFEPSAFYALPYEHRSEDHSKYIDNNTYAIHLWDHSWDDKVVKKRIYLFRSLKTVLIDYLFYGYSKQYFIRYFRGFSRQLYYLLIGKQTK